MSRLYDTVEPSVIDDVMLRKCIEEQTVEEKGNEAGAIAKNDGVFYHEVLSLRLDFKSLFFFPSELDGNCIDGNNSK